MTEFQPKILAYCCNWCAYAGADLAGTSRIQYPPNVRIVKVMCSGRVDPAVVLSAFRQGMDGVLVAGCHPGDCHYISGNEQAAIRMAFLRNFLDEVGIDRERFRFEWIAGSEGSKFARIVQDMVDGLRRLGPFRPESLVPAGGAGR